MESMDSSEEDSERGTSSEEGPQEVKGGSTRRLDPNEVNRSNWYETSVRIRMTYYVFNTVAVCLAVSLGVIVNIFFTIMAAGSFDRALVLRILLLPLGLIGSAILVDEMLDLGLDGMMSPSLAQWRSTFSLAVQALVSSFSTRGAELCLLIAFEGVPLVAAIVSVFTVGSVPALHKAINFLNHYLRGAVFLIVILSLAYLVSRLYVQGSDLRVRKMTALYHSIDHVGRFSPAVDAAPPVGASNGDERRPWQRCRRCLGFLCVALVIDGLVLLVFYFQRRFDVLLLGQFVITIAGACAIKARIPKLLGRAFWYVFVFFLILTFGLWLGAHKQTAEKVLKPLCVGPQDPSYDQSGFDLPLHFVPPTNGRGYGYPVCSGHWGNRNMSVDNQLNIFDLASLAFASSYSSEEQIRANLHAVFDGTPLESWNLTHVEPANVVGRWIVVDFPKQRTRVVAVRGTSTLEDVYADLEVYGGIAVFQFMNLWVPVLQVLGADAVRSLIDTDVPKFWDKFLQVVSAEKSEALAEGSSLVITGHSLGAALAGVGAAENNVQSVGFSPPGLFYQTKHLDVDLQALQRIFTSVQPEGDIVPRVDRQRGSVNWVKCATKPGTCHKLTKTTCELWSQCGDPRSRDFRATCQEWYSRDDLNM